ncbi:unnamed protein product [Heterosigma akashiwo]
MKTNLGKGTLKMLVGGAGQIKLTKDGKVLLHEMQIQHPTAMLIGRTATAQDDITGDGTTSVIIFCGELLKQAERHLSEGLHPRVITEGFDLARDRVLTFLDGFKVATPDPDRELLMNVARTALRTKLEPQLADGITEAVTDACLCVRAPGQPLDLHMVEILHMAHRDAADTRLVRGMVLDHGPRHPDMPTKLENCRVLTVNVSFEYEKTEVQSGFFYSSAEQRERMVEAERKFTGDKASPTPPPPPARPCPKSAGRTVVINQKGIDPLLAGHVRQGGHHGHPAGQAAQHGAADARLRGPPGQLRGGHDRGHAGLRGQGVGDHAGRGEVHLRGGRGQPAELHHPDQGPQPAHDHPGAGRAPRRPARREELPGGRRGGARAAAAEAAASTCRPHDARGAREAGRGGVRGRAAGGAQDAGRELRLGRAGRWAIQMQAPPPHPPHTPHTPHPTNAAGRWRQRRRRPRGPGPGHRRAHGPRPGGHLGQLSGKEAVFAS